MTLKCQRNNLMHVEETMWHQRSRVLWLKQGDHNTKKIHGKASQMRSTNTINKLMGDLGCWWNEGLHCERILVNYFTNILTTSSPINIP